MPGITSYGVHIPIYRMSGETLGQVWGRGVKGERAVANIDEDSMTMGVAAARNCLKGVDKDSIDVVYFASTTPPYKEKQSASIIATALDLREEGLVTADITDSLRSGTIAIGMALDAVKAGSARKALVVVGESRIGAPDSAFESFFGDGAVAFVIEKDGAAVELEASHCVTTAFIDIWRMEYDKLPKMWESRFVREEGYEPYSDKALKGLLDKTKLTYKDFAKIAYNAPDKGMYRDMAKRMGWDPKTQVQDSLFEKIGYTGTAHTLILLVGALEDAKPGDRILVSTYGDGVDAMAFRVTDNIDRVQDRKSLTRNIESKMMLSTYGRYIKFKDLMEFERSFAHEVRTALPELWRHRNWVYRFHGVKCQKCGRIMMPIPQHCIYCQASDEFFDEVPLADKKGTLVTYSLDERAPVVDPPNVLAALNFEGGGRFFSQMTDRDPSKVEVGMPMEVTFRRIHDALDVHNYFWKCMPVR